MRAEKVRRPIFIGGDSPTALVRVAWQRRQIER